MTDAQKLEALIQKAIDGGWDMYGIFCKPFKISKNSKWHIDNKHAVVVFPGAIEGCHNFHINLDQFMWRHDFARALFPGNSKTVIYTLDGHTKKTVATPVLNFHYRLQQAVILPALSEQIDYMYKAVFGDT